MSKDSLLLRVLLVCAVAAGLFFPVVQAQDSRRRIVKLSDGKRPGTGPLLSEGSQSTGCDEESFMAARARFQRLREMRRRDASSVSQSEFREASFQYIVWAETCFQEWYGEMAETGQKIDDGGLWSPGYGPGRFRHNLFGTKWGSGSPFLPLGDNPDTEGPQSPGGTVTYSFMSNGVDMSSEDAGSNPTDDPNTAISSLGTFSSCFFTEIEKAFAAWSAVANIQFLPVSDNGAAFNALGATGDIRIGAHAIDGASGVLAHAYFPPPNGTSAAGDLHFDEAESWACDPFLGGIDIGMVAMHEIGHSIGLRHETVDSAVMVTPYNPATRLTGLLADDIHGATQIYGANPDKRSFFADLGIGTEAPEKVLHVRGFSDALVAANNTMIRVENASSVAGTRRMLELINNGVPLLVYRNTAEGTTWSMSPQGTGFSISKGGTGATELFLGQGGDLKIAGDLTANGVLYTSDRAAKSDVEPLDTLQVLGKVLEIPLASWSYQRDSTSSRHVGPMAQDFYRTFGLGKDGQHISTSDISGVALAAIQGLHKHFSAEIARRDSEIERLQRENEKALAALKCRLVSLEAKLDRADALVARLAALNDRLRNRQIADSVEKAE